MRAVWLLCELAVLLCCGAASAQVTRYAVIVGNNAGATDEPRLRYAERDAAKVHRVLAELGGFLPENMTLLAGKGASTIRRVLIAFNARIREHVRHGSSLLLFYYSGHADARALHTGGSKLSLRQLEQLITGSAATFRLGIVDACRSGAITRVKGGKPRPPLKIWLNERLAGTGAVFLTSSSANENAQESDQIRGSLFTHYLVSGLMGAADRNRDGRIVLQEAYQHAYSNTIRASSRTLSGIQHPTFRFVVRGHGQLVLTRPRDQQRQRGRLRLPRGFTFLVFRGSRGGDVVAEVEARSRARMVSLAPGSYFVRGRGRDVLLEGEVRLHRGQDRWVRENQLHRIAYAQLVRKGGGIKSLGHGPQAGYRFQTPLSNSERLCHGGFVGYGLVLRHLTAALRLGGCRSAFTNEHGIGVTVDQLDLGLRFGYALDVSRFTLELGVDAGVGLMLQSFDTTRITSDRRSFMGQVGPVAGLGLNLPHGVAVALELAAPTHFFRQADWREDSSEGEPQAAFALRPGMAISKVW